MKYFEMRDSRGTSNNLVLCKNKESFNRVVYFNAVMWIRIDCIRIHKVCSIRIRIRIQVHKISKFSKHLSIFKSQKNF